MNCPICSTANPSHALHCSACGAPTSAASVALSPDALPIGTPLQGGNFTVEAVLGQGGFGITYHAADSSLVRHVAIKEFFPASCARQGVTVQPAGGLTPAAYGDGRHRFLEEARHLARFHHPGIVAVHSIFEENNTAYMVMEYLQGQSLTEVRHERGSRMSDGEAIGIIQRAGHSLEVVHGAGLLHRDIKPDNIILCADGRVVLIDFGAARDFAAGAIQGHTIAVTPGYAPLEQYASRAQRGVYTDVYGLAATLYYLLTGEAPTAASDRAMGVLLPTVESLNPNVNRTVARAVMQGLETEIAKRPQSVREFLDRLEGKIISTARYESADEDVDFLNVIKNRHPELLHSTDPEVRQFLRSLDLQYAPDYPLPSSWDDRTFAAHLKAREALLKVSAGNAQPQQPDPAPVQVLSSPPQPKSRILRLSLVTSLLVILLALSPFVSFVGWILSSYRRPSPAPPAPVGVQLHPGRDQFESQPGLSTPPSIMTPKIEQVLQRHEAFEAAWEVRNVQECMRFYTPDAVIQLQQAVSQDTAESISLNREQWQARLQAQWANPDNASPRTLRSGRPNAVEYSDTAPLRFRHAVSVSRSHSLYKPGSRVRVEHYYRHQAWQKRQGRWMIIEDRINIVTLGHSHVGTLGHSRDKIQKGSVDSGSMSKK